MTTDHTETPETEAHLEATRTSPGPNLWASADFARQLEKERNEARAALATAMAERDEARKRDAIHKVNCEIGQQTLSALRARNEALTKALEDAERVMRLAERNLSNPQSHGELVRNHLAPTIIHARRALGKEGL